MNILIFVITMLVLVFGFVILFGAPFLPTLRDRTEDALDMLNLKPGQTLLELGSGDGRVLRAAAQRGIRGIGYELNPLLVLYSKVRNWRYRHLITFKWRNYWLGALPKCDGIYVFLLDKYMLKLDKKIMQDIGHAKLVSYAFKIPNRKIAQEKNGLFLYKY
jgi:hypothetical protein